MPIRFRCIHCDQLLGIARRKAGLAVQCPTCRKQVLVPHHDQPDPSVPAPASASAVRPGHLPPPAPAPAPVPAPIPARPMLFERDDYDDLLNAPATSRSSLPPAPPVPAPTPFRLPVPEQGGTAVSKDLAESPPVVFEGQALPPAAIVLSPARATALTVVFIVLLAAAFGSGLIIGRFCFGP